MGSETKVLCLSARLSARFWLVSLGASYAAPSAGIRAVAQ